MGPALTSEAAMAFSQVMLVTWSCKPALFLLPPRNHLAHLEHDDGMFKRLKEQQHSSQVGKAMSISGLPVSVKLVPNSLGRPGNNSKQIQLSGEATKQEVLFRQSMLPAEAHALLQLHESNSDSAGEA